MRFPQVWLLTLLLAGCTPAAEPPAPVRPASLGPVSITNCGETVTVTAPPERAVTLDQAATEIMLALGLQERMVGTAHLQDEILPEFAPAYAKIPVLAGGYPTRDRVLQAEPDFVYASHPGAFGPGRADWRTVGTYLSPAGCADPATKLRIDDVFGEIRQIAAIFGVPDRGERLVAEHQGRIATATQTEVENERNVSVVWWDGSGEAPGVGTCCGVPGLIMEEAGVTNVFADLPGSARNITWETVAGRDPQVIVLVGAGAGRTAPTSSAHSVALPLSAATAGIRTVLAIETIAGRVPTLTPPPA